MATAAVVKSVDGEETKILPKTTPGGWSPYELHGGTCLGISGKDFCVLASDTRLARGYTILTRKATFAKTLTPKCVVTTGGCFPDVTALHKDMEYQLQMYEHEHGEQMSTRACSQLLSNKLYGRRFFPYYAFNLLGGVDAEGKGVLYNYDAPFMIPLLDNLVGHRSRVDPAPEMTIDRAVGLAKEAFVAAGERDIYTGDDVEIFKITSAGVEKEIFKLKSD